MKVAPAAVISDVVYALSEDYVEHPARPIAAEIPALEREPQRDVPTKFTRMVSG